MNMRERFLSVMRFERPDDRLPMIEWAGWWDLTTNRWKKEGMPKCTSYDETYDYFHLDRLECIKAGGCSAKCPEPAYHGAPIITDEASYEAIRPFILNDELVERYRQDALNFRERHEMGEIAIRLWFDGFFWFPRTLFGIENHFYAFYDYPALMHRINNDLAEYDIRVMEAIFPILTPDMVGFAEDMSYNHGPMLSYELFQDFLMPYYAKVVPYMKERGIKVMVDTDGDVTQMIPWLLEAGMDGIYPLERQAGVDIAKIRETYPDLLLMGAYDKMVMSKGEREMRAEFERLLPIMRSGGYVPATDHQVPPEVSLDNFRLYLRLYREYCEKAVKG